MEKQFIKASKFLYFKTIDSTHLLAKKTIQNNNVNWQNSIIYSQNQTNGVGRHDRKWLGANGNVFASIMCNVTNFDTSNIAIIISVGIFRALNNLTNCNNDLAKNNSQKTTLSPILQIKWPNDILKNNKKICGILIDIIDNQNSKFDNQNSKLAIISFGINTKNIPDQLFEIAEKIEINHSAKNIILNIVESINVCYHEYQLSTIEIINEYNKNSAQKTVKITVDGKILEHIFYGLDQNGVAILKCVNDGAMRYVNSNEIFVE